MTGMEKQVLKIVRELEEADKESVARKIGVSERYAAQICQFLIKDGYLIERSKEKYKITERGKKAISSVKTVGLIPVLKGGI